MAKRKVLIISTVGLIYDGITSVITSYLEAMDLSDLDVRIVGTIKVEPAIRNKIECLGCIIIDLPNRRYDTFRYFNALRKYIKKEKIDVVHVHGNSATLTVDLLAAKLGGAKKRIAHSHNTKCLHLKADKLLRPMFYHLYTDAIACGEDAGKWLYSRRTFQVLKNGRDIEKYKFDPIERQRMRKKYGMKDELVIGHVGGFVEQKNHKFLISVFREVLKSRHDAKLFLVGDGVLRRDIENLVKDIEGSVVFVGNTDHVSDYLQMMDVMLLPSLFEGLPLVVIEWQINGLPCLISNVVTEECVLGESSRIMSLTQDVAEWAKLLEKLYTHYVDRNQLSICNIRQAREKGFDINVEAKKLEEIYMRE